jgi:hypothetical protein
MTDATMSREDIAVFLASLKKLRDGLDDFNCQVAAIDGDFERRPILHALKRKSITASAIVLCFAPRCLSPPPSMSRPIAAVTAGWWSGSWRVPGGLRSRNERGGGP